MPAVGCPGDISSPVSAFSAVPSVGHHARWTARLKHAASCNQPHTCSVCCAEEEELARAQEQQAVLLVPADNDDVTEVLQLLEQELSAFEEQELQGVGQGRGHDRGSMGDRSSASAARIETEELVGLAHEAALSR